MALGGQSDSPWQKQRGPHITGPSLRHLGQRHRPARGVEKRNRLPQETGLLLPEWPRTERPSASQEGLHPRASRVTMGGKGKHIVCLAFTLSGTLARKRTCSYPGAGEGEAGVPWCPNSAHLQNAYLKAPLCVTPREASLLHFIKRR